MNFAQTINSSVAGDERMQIFQSSQQYLHSNSMSQTLKVQLIENLENENVEIKERLRNNSRFIEQLETELKHLKKNISNF